MSEKSDILTDGVRWGSRLAIVGIIIAALSLTVSVFGIGSANPMYWAGIFLSIIAVTGAAVRGVRTTDTDGDGTPDYKDTDADGNSVPHSEEEYLVVHHAGWVISAMLGVFVIGYGVENGILLLVLVGVGILVVGALRVIFDTQ